MKFERLITNLAVVLGMVLVVFELQQNREAIQIAHQLSLAGLMSQAHMAVASDHELADLITRAKRNDTLDFSPADIEHTEGTRSCNNTYRQKASHTTCQIRA